MTLLGAGVASASFTPLSLSPALWLKADAGLVTDGAAQFTAASSQYLSIADNANFAFTTAFSASFWVKRNAVTGFDTYLSKWTYQTDGGWAIQSGANSYADLCVFLAGSAGDPGNNSFEFTDVDMSANTWYHVAVIYDGSLTGNANRLKCYVNGVQKTQNVVAGAVPASLQADGAPLRLGAWSGSLTRYLDGYLDNVRIWSRAITAGEVASEYASGAGRNYAAMSTSDKVSLVCAYDFASPGSGLVADSHGSNTLTNNNAVTYAAGIVSGTASADGDPVTTWQDQSGNGRHASAATSAKRPTLKLAIQNGLPALLFDGVDDYLAATVTTIAQPHTVAIVGKATGAGNQFYFDGANVTAAVTNATSTTAVRMYAGANLDKSGLTADAWRIILAEFNGASSKNYVNNLAAATGDAGSSATGTTLYLGAYGAGPSAFLNGYLGEVLVVPSILSSQQRSDLQTYLNTRFRVY